MDDFFNLAVVLIYPDGYVDPIPIKKGIDNHVTYFYDYLTISPRFQKMVKDNGFKFDWIHEYNTAPILKLLTSNGVIVFINNAIVYVNMAPERASEISTFSIVFPRVYEQHAGFPFIKEIIKKLDDNQYELNKYYPEIHNFDNFDSDEARIFLDMIEKNEEDKNIGLV